RGGGALAEFAPVVETEVESRVGIARHPGLRSFAMRARTSWPAGWRALVAGERPLVGIVRHGAMRARDKSPHPGGIARAGLAPGGSCGRTAQESKRRRKSRLLRAQLIRL